jgi:hypothetical protein
MGIWGEKPGKGRTWNWMGPWELGFPFNERAIWIRGKSLQGNGKNELAQWPNPAALGPAKHGKNNWKEEGTGTGMNLNGNLS